MTTVTTDPLSTGPAIPAPGGRLARLARGRPGDPRWVRPALLTVLALTAALYAVGLSRNGWANDFYAAAVQAGTKSWKAFFFGSFDASNFITVDKTPASLWVMELSARAFGLNSWSLLLPQAAEGVAAVALLYATVRRWSGPAAGLIAAAVLALTPVAALMFRFNNPDALLVLLMTAAAYATTRATESGRTRWLVLTGTLLGFAFLTKMLQGFLVIPAFVLGYLVAGPPRLGRRLLQLLAGGAALLVSAGWWVAIVQLTPAADRPYIGGSTDNSVLQLALGYNGLGRLDGNETGSVGFHGGAGPSFSGQAGLARLFAADMGGQVSWLLPAALIALAALVFLSWRSVRTDRLGQGPGDEVTAKAPRRSRGGFWPPGGSGGSLPRTNRAFRPSGGSGPWGPGAGLSQGGVLPRAYTAAALLWGGWLLVTGGVFSFMAGIIHPYYTIALAPAIGALTGIGAVALWRRRDHAGARLTLAAGVAVTGIWAYLLLDRTPAWLPWLRAVVLLCGLLAAAAILAGPAMARLAAASRGRRALAAAPIVLALVAALAGPAAYSIDTAATAHTGALPSAGPAVTGAFGGGGPGGGGFPGAGAGTGRSGSQSGPGFPGGTQAPGGANSATGGVPGSTATGRAGIPQGFGAAGASRAGQRGFAPGGAGGPGGLAGNTQVASALTKLLQQGASGYRWAAATVGTESAAPLQLASGEPVMAIGGFNGTDDTPTLAEFERLVSAGEIHYFVGANQASFGGGSGPAAQITAWVRGHFRSETVGGETVYNLTHSRT
jgi:4-amino-4-deoxy-L-arabinose transferase-like glycosyltransferase